MTLQNAVFIPIQGIKGTGIYTTRAGTAAANYRKGGSLTQPCHTILIRVWPVVVPTAHDAGFALIAYFQVDDQPFEA